MLWRVLKIAALGIGAYVAFLMGSRKLSFRQALAELPVVGDSLVKLTASRASVKVSAEQLAAAAASDKARLAGF